MKVLILSKEGDGLGVAQRLILEGHDVDVWIAESRFALAGKGIVNRVPSWPGPARQADLIIVDCVGLGKWEKQLRALDKPIIGLSATLDKIELDRALGMKVFETAGLTIPETYSFDSTAEAQKIKDNIEWQTGLVIKPSGNLSTSKTMVVKDETGWDRCLSQLSPDCNGILQRIVAGIEVSTEGWFNGRRFLTPFNHTFEEKRFLAGGLGVNTGCMGNIVISAGAGNRLTAATVARLDSLLTHCDYRGPFDVNCIVTAEAAYALEATSRMGYDAVEALIEGLDEPIGDLLYDIARGGRSDMRLGDDTMIAVRLSIPPWPVQKPQSNSAGEPVTGIDESTLPHLFLTDLYKKDDDYFTAGGDGVLLKATAVGRARKNGTIMDYTYEARRRVYRTLENISVSGKQYRVDIGERANKEIAQLKEWGWL